MVEVKERVEVVEQRGRARPGIPVAVLAIVAILAMIAVFVVALMVESWMLAVASVLVFVGAIFVAVGLYMVQPNKAAVLTLFGDYRGSDDEPGLRWANPLYGKRMISLRVRNFTTHTSKVNDSNGNPIMIAAVVVWQVVETAKAVFAVDDFVDYVTVQSEAAVRHMARSYPYDAFDEDHTVTMIDDVDQVNSSLEVELVERVQAAGVEIVEARLTDLSYAPEIAEAMLRRQQASAIVAARKKIVEGAVLMTRDAIVQLQEGSDEADAIPLDADRRATFASNLMTVIASDQPTNPIVNVGTLTR